MTKALYTAQMAHRLIHGQFINHKGGAGNNYANNLKMEHIIKNNKVILKGLCANKTLKAVQQSSSAAYGVHQIVNNFDEQSDILPDSTAHTHADKHNDEIEMIETVRKTRPFTFNPGREFKSFTGIAWLTHHKNRLFQSPFYQMNIEEENGDDEAAETNETSDVEKDSDDE